MNDTNVKINGKPANWRVGLLLEILKQYPAIGYTIADIEFGGVLKLTPRRKVLHPDLQTGFHQAQDGIADMKEHIDNFDGDFEVEDPQLATLVARAEEAVEAIARHLDNDYK
jgi:hypothetical protein